MMSRSFWGYNCPGDSLETDVNVTDVRRRIPIVHFAVAAKIMIANLPPAYHQ